MEDLPQISLVIPVYNEQENIIPLHTALSATLNKLDRKSEIVFIDDGSRDGSFNLIKKIAEEDKRIKGISLSRNFGYQIALMAGLQHAKGNLIITMDADLQHPPELIPLLIKEYEKGFDIVNTQRTYGKETGFFKKMSSVFFSRTINKIANIQIPEGASDFRLMSRTALDAFLQFGERDRFMRGLVSWMGFNQSAIAYTCPPRLSGKSKYTLRRMIHLAADGIISFSSRPLRIASYIGMVVFLIGFAYAIYAIMQHIAGKTIPGWTSLLVSVLLLGGIQLLMLGIIGEYLARIYNESKSRPLYFIKSKIN